MLENFSQMQENFTRVSKVFVNLILKYMITCVFGLSFLGASSMTLVDSSCLIESMSTNVCPLPRVAMTTRSKPALVASSACPSLDEKSHSVSRPEEKEQKHMKVALYFHIIRQPSLKFAIFPYLSPNMMLCDPSSPRASWRSGLGVSD